MIIMRGVIKLIKYFIPKSAAKSITKDSIGSALFAANRVKLAKFCVMMFGTGQGLLTVGMHIYYLKYGLVEIIL